MGVPPTNFSRDHSKLSDSSAIWGLPKIDLGWSWLCDSLLYAKMEVPELSRETRHLQKLNHVALLVL